jgi:hypothetical protein
MSSSNYRKNYRVPPADRVALPARQHGHLRRQHGPPAGGVVPPGDRVALPAGGVVPPADGVVPPADGADGADGVVPPVVPPADGADGADGVVPPVVPPADGADGVVPPVVPPAGGVVPPADGVVPQRRYIPWREDIIQPSQQGYERGWLKEARGRVKATLSYSHKIIKTRFDEMLAIKAELQTLENVFSLNISDSDKVLIVDYPNLLKVNEKMEITTNDKVYLYTNFFKFPLVFILNMMITEGYTKLYIITKGSEIIDSFNNLMENKIAYDDRKIGYEHNNNITHIQYNMTDIINSIIEKITNRSITIDIIQSTSYIPRNDTSKKDPPLKILNSYDDCTIMYLAILLSRLHTNFTLISNDLKMIDEFVQEKDVILPYFLTKSSLELDSTNIKFTNKSYLINTMDFFFKSTLAKDIPSKRILQSMVCNVELNPFCKGSLNTKLNEHYYMLAQGKNHILLHTGKPNKAVVNDIRENVLRNTTDLGIPNNALVANRYLLSDNLDLGTTHIPKYIPSNILPGRIFDMSAQLLHLSDYEYDLRINKEFDKRYKGPLYDYVGNLLQKLHPTKPDFICDGMPYKGRLYNSPFGTVNREQIQQYNPTGTVKFYNDTEFYDVTVNTDGTYVQYYNTQKEFYYHIGDPRDTLPNYNLSLDYQITNAQDQSMRQFKDRYTRLLDKYNTEVQTLDGIKHILQSIHYNYTRIKEDELNWYNKEIKEIIVVQQHYNPEMVHQILTQVRNQHSANIRYNQNQYEQLVFSQERFIEDQTRKVAEADTALKNPLFPELPKKQDIPGAIIAQNLPIPNQYYSKYIKYKSKYLELKNKITNVNNDK